MTWSALLALVTLFLCILPGIRIVPEGEGLVVLRLGRFHRVLGPGIHIVVFGLGAAQRAALESLHCDGQSQSEEELAHELEHLAGTGQLGTTV